MSATVAERKLTRKQSYRLRELIESEQEISVVGWHEQLQGPILHFHKTGYDFVVTKDGGLQYL